MDIAAINAIRAVAQVPEGTPVGVWSTFGRNSVVKETPDGGRSIDVTATTDDIDMDREAVLPQGADLTYWRANGFKFYADHRYDVASVCGVVRENSLRLFPDATSPRGWKMSVGVMKNPVGDAVVAIARETGMIGASIGFRPVEYVVPTAEAGPSAPERIISKWLWLETSFTAFPCNANCQGRIIDGESKMADELDRLVTKGLVTRRAAEILGMPVERKTARRRIIMHWR